MISKYATLENGSWAFRKLPKNGIKQANGSTYFLINVPFRLYRNTETNLQKYVGKGSPGDYLVTSHPVTFNWFSVLSAKRYADRWQIAVTQESNRMRNKHKPSRTSEILKNPGFSTHIAEETNRGIGNATVLTSWRASATGQRLRHVQRARHRQRSATARVRKFTAFTTPSLPRSTWGGY